MRRLGLKPVSQLLPRGAAVDREVGPHQAPRLMVSAAGPLDMPVDHRRVRRRCNRCDVSFWIKTRGTLVLASKEVGRPIIGPLNPPRLLVDPKVGATPSLREDMVSALAPLASAGVGLLTVPIGAIVEATLRKVAGNMISTLALGAEVKIICPPEFR